MPVTPTTFARCAHALALSAMLMAIACADEARTPRSERGALDAGMPPADANLQDAGRTPDAGPTPAITAEALFAEDAPIWHFDLELTETDLAWLDAHAAEEMYRPGALLFRGQRHDDVAIRYKGGYGSLRGCFDDAGELTCSKLSLKVSFNETNKDRRFAGLRKLIFHACNRDRTCLRERISYGLFRDMGVETCRTAHATVSINGGPKQLYALVEYIDNEFVQDHFEDGNGNLYKEAWPVIPTESYYVEHLQTNEAAPDVQRMLDLAQVLASTTTPDLASYDQRVMPFVDLERMARYTAVDLLTHNWDGIWKFYCATPEHCGNHNYYIYDDPSSGRLAIIPWDLDHTFTEPFEDMGRSFRDDGPGVCELQDASVPGITLAGIKNPQCDPLMQGFYQGAGWDRYQRALRELLDGEHTHEAAVLARLDRYRARVRQTVEEDPSALPIDEWDGAVATLRQIIRAQYRAAEALVQER